DEEPAAIRDADEGDSEEVQERQAEAERGADEVLPGEQRQPGRLVSADARAVPGLHRALLRVAPLLQRGAVAAPGLALVPALHPLDRGSHDVALGRLRAAGRLRRLADGLDALHVGDGRQNAADDLHADAARL